MKILLTGSSGLLGSSIIAELLKKNYQFTRLIRTESECNTDIKWNPETGDTYNPLDFDISVVVHLNGQNLLSGRWSKKLKRTLYESRIYSTKNLVHLIKKLPQPPILLITASAVGFYGNQEEKILTEESGNGSGFLAGVCKDWEDAAKNLADIGTRICHLRLGVVLSNKGGALSMMKPAFKLGMGGILGDGKQFMSWISIDDVVSIIEYIITNETLEGPINLVSPNPVTNREFTKTLGKVLNRPTLFPVPKIILKLLLGEIADELLLSSTRVIPAKLDAAGYKFKYPDLNETLTHLLK